MPLVKKAKMLQMLRFSAKKEVWLPRSSLCFGVRKGLEKNLKIESQ
jgi:hypothetical protein